MRFSRVDLDKYGHFTGLRLDLPYRSPDLHILVGDNEAGKSTAQAALTDLLHGFEHRTDYAFLHDMRDLRVGARIEAGDLALDAWRRKARSNSLQNSDGEPLDDDALDAFLVGVDRDAFLQQFSLNHLRLRAGGEAILDAGNDLGRMLFQASAGLDWLGERLRQLEEQCGEVFRPAGSKQTLAKALKRRDQALKQKKEAAASDRVFREARSAEHQAREDLNDQTAKREKIAAERTKLERARWVIPILRKIDQCKTDLETLGPLPSIPAQIRETFDTATQVHQDAHRAAETAKGELDKAQKACDAVIVDDQMLAREDEIELILGPLRSRHLTAEEDLPRRLAELKGQEAAILSHCREVGRPDMTAETVADYLPTRQQVATLRRLASGQREHAQDVKNAGEAVKKNQKDRQEAEVATEAFGPTPDVAPLCNAIEAVSADPGLGTRIEQAENRLAGANDDIAKRSGKMVPTAPKGVLRKNLPSAAIVAQFMTDLTALDVRLEKQSDEHRRLESQKAEQDRDHETLVATGGAVPQEHLEAARARRDLGWDFVRQRYIDGEIPDPAAEKAFAADQTLPGAFTAAIADADAVADARFDAAEISGKLAAKTADLHSLDRKKTDLTNYIDRDKTERENLLARWQAAWADSGIVPEAPSAMVEWLRELEMIEASQIDRQNIENDLAEERNTETRLRAALVATLVGLGKSEPDATEALNRVLTRAQGIRTTIEDQERDRSAVTDKVLMLTRDEGEAVQALAEAQDALAEWRTIWSARMIEWSLPADTDPADVEPVLDAWDSIRTAIDRISGDQGLRHRIKTMKEDQELFVKRLEDVVVAVAPELQGQPVLHAGQELRRGLAKARSDRDLKSSATENVNIRTDAHNGAVESERKAKKILEDILRQIGVDSVEAAEPVLDRVEEGAQTERTLAELHDSLQQAGNGLAEAALRIECEDLDFDALDGQLASLESEDGVVFHEVQRLGGILGERKAELDTFMQAGAEAANAAEEAERASTEALRASERYIRLQTTATLLRYAIQRYRKENEGPLLRRASGLFRNLTLDKFTGLEIDHDSDEKPVLRARRANNGASVPIEGLSDGTRDQLFLALRLAGIEELLSKGTVLPFVADDLFVNFDDDRALAGLRVMADLATRTQVLFFTHHRHLLDLASKHIPDHFNKVQLAV